MHARPSSRGRFGAAAFKKTALAPEKRLQMKKSTTKKRGVKINFHRVLLGFFENWDKSPQKKWDKGENTTVGDVFV